MGRKEITPVHVIGGGLAGCEAAWQLAKAGVPAVIHEICDDLLARGRMEAPIWNDLHARRALTMATLTRLDISTKTTTGAVQYLVVAIFASDEGHHEHDTDPRFEAWNRRADAYQVAEPFVFGGDTIVNAGP